MAEFSHSILVQCWPSQRWTASFDLAFSFRNVPFSSVSSSSTPVLSLEQPKLAVHSVAAMMLATQLSQSPLWCPQARVNLCRPSVSWGRPGPDDHKGGGGSRNIYDQGQVASAFFRQRGDFCDPLLFIRYHGWIKVIMYSVRSVFCFCPPCVHPGWVSTILYPSPFI